MTPPFSQKDGGELGGWGVSMVGTQGGGVLGWWGLREVGTLK